MLTYKVTRQYKCSFKTFLRIVCMSRKAIAYFMQWLIINIYNRKKRATAPFRLAEVVSSWLAPTHKIGRRDRQVVDSLQKQWARSQLYEWSEGPKGPDLHLQASAKAQTERRGRYGFWFWTCIYWFGPSTPTGWVRQCQREQIHQTNTQVAPLLYHPKLWRWWQ